MSIKIVLIGGSVRPGNYTMKALHLVADELNQIENVEVELIDPQKLGLAQPGLALTEDSKKLQESVASATGVILATPEYHGSISSVIKEVIENLGFPSVLAGKPVALLGVAAGVIGAIKSLEQLRSICSHVGSIVLPGAVSVAGVQKIFDEQGVCLDQGTEKRIRGVATALVDYIHQNICPRNTLENMVRN